ncbi:MAG: FAD-binding protein, partial [Thermomicrobiales bacterium]|nr:FAD-binding protein [Thermomicrobiales bacterium]
MMHRATRRVILDAGAGLLASAFMRPAHSRARQATALTGQVIWPGAAEYEATRLDFNARFSRYPAAIVVCTKVRDVQNVVRYARQQALPIRARSGGHSYEAYSVVDG